MYIVSWHNEAVRHIWDDVESFLSTKTIEASEGLSSTNTASGLIGPLKLWTYASSTSPSGCNNLESAVASCVRHGFSVAFTLRSL